jgi:hypothetical protein
MRLHHNIAKNNNQNTFLEAFFKVTQLPSGWALSMAISPLQVLCTSILLDDSLMAENQ